ncbi:MAG: hypothetical protein MK289_22325 [Trichodesmium sp. ALOHA_ZT_67]|uniref:hypothetical protein n=1 Tax=Trichodesmium erythraeum TaxID=1206 RepID=UPI0012DC0766|nr:hypothetical protein [Trichodesmium erythraeum GBRTRLIN201]MCH2051095.1 hypothetical protein [Trichodesmium sp. ALOHA_ZT_67]
MDISTLSTFIYQRQCLADAPGQNITAFYTSSSIAASSPSEFESLFKEVFSNAGIEIKPSTQKTKSSSIQLL